MTSASTTTKTIFNQKSFRLRWDNKMRDVVIHLPLFSRMAQWSLKCACALNRINVMSQKVILKKVSYSSHFNSSKSVKLCKFTSSYKCIKCWCVGQDGVITMTISSSAIYCKRVTFCDVFFLAPLAVESPRKIKYTAKCAFIKVRISGYKSTTKSNPRLIEENLKNAKYRTR